MADGYTHEATSSSKLTGGAQEQTVEINIKTLDSQIYTFRVEKDTPIPSLKEKIASTIGIPAAQQRLIFRGRVLKDDHTLSEYHVEDGCTLHLVARQPVQQQTQSGSGTTETAGNNRDGSRGNDVAGIAPRTRIGQSVVVGLNVGEVRVADVNQILGLLLNSLGLGAPNNAAEAGNSSTAQTSETRTQNAIGGAQIGNQPSQNSLMGAVLRQMVIPDSLTTLSSFMTCMEQALSLHSGNQPPIPLNSEAPPRVDSPLSNSLGYPSPDALITVMNQARELLSGPAPAALHHLSERLERERTSSDLAVRGQIQGEAMHVGVTMQHLGSLLLELGRTISTLRMGEPSAEPIVNAGPAVYINASGPNPLMVQPIPHQPSPIFGIPSLQPLVNIGVPDSAVLGDAHRNINIHVHAGTPAAAGTPIGPTENGGEATPGLSANHGSPVINIGGQGQSGLTRLLPSRTVVTAIPAHSRPGSATSPVLNVINPIDMRLQPSSLSNPGLIGGSVGSTDGSGPQVNARTDPPGSVVVSQINSALANALSANVQGQSLLGHSLQSLSNVLQVNVRTDASQPPSGSDAISVTNIDATAQNPTLDDEDKELAETGEASENFASSQASDTATIGVGGQKVPASGSTHDKSLLDGSSGKSAVNDSMNASGSSSSKDNDAPVPLGLGPGGLQPMRRSKKPLSQGKSAVPHDWSNGDENQQLIAKGQEVLQSLASQSSKEKQFPIVQPFPKLEVGSSASSRSMQQTGEQNSNIGGMFSGMLQQMMPLMSQAFGMGQSRSSPSTTSGSMQQITTNRNDMSEDINIQIDLRPVAERIERQDHAEDIYHEMLEAVGHLYEEEDSRGSLVEDLRNDEDLTEEFMELLRRDLCQRMEPKV